MKLLYVGEQHRTKEALADFSGQEDISITNCHDITRAIVEHTFVNGSYHCMILHDPGVCRTYN